MLNTLALFLMHANKIGIQQTRLKEAKNTVQWWAMMTNCNLEKYDTVYRWSQFYIYHGKNTQNQNSPFFCLFISKLEMHLIYKP